MTIQEISDLLDSKLEPLNQKISSLEMRIDSLSKDVRAVLKFVPTGNEDIEETLKKHRKKVA